MIHCDTEENHTQGTASLAIYTSVFVRWNPELESTLPLEDDCITGRSLQQQFPLHTPTATKNVADEFDGFYGLLAVFTVSIMQWTGGEGGRSASGLSQPELVFQAADDSRERTWDLVERGDAVYPSAFVSPSATSPCSCPVANIRSCTLPDDPVRCSIYTSHPSSESLAGILVVSSFSG